jgi:hypothetical protein
MSKIRNGVLAAGLIIVVMFAMATPAGAVKDLVITNYNKGYLADTYWTPYYNGWLPNAELLGWASSQYYLDATYKSMRWVGSIQSTMVSDNTNQFPGQCVSLAKALSKSNVPTIAQYPGDTNHWTKGRQVMGSNVVRGTVIAKFNADGTYDSWGSTGHAAIFDVYATMQGSNIRKDGFRVWDQNFVSPSVVGRHILWAESSGVYNANNYYVVQVP